MHPTTPTTVRVDLNGHGAWDVALTGEDEPITCDTLDDAREVASKFAAHRRPCELIVRDAYHRVLRREFINGQAGAVVSSRRSR